MGKPSMGRRQLAALLALAIGSGATAHGVRAEEQTAAPPAPPAASAPAPSAPVGEAAATSEAKAADKPSRAASTEPAAPTATAGEARTADAIAPAAAPPAATPVAPAAAPAAPVAAPVVPAATPVVPTVDPLLAVIKDRLGKTKLAAGDKAAFTALEAYYGKPDAKPLWIADGAFNARAKSALKAFAEADDWGLEASAFQPPAAPAAAAGNEQLADAEIGLGLTALKYARFASGGRIDPRKLSKYVDVDPPVADPVAVVAALAASEDANSVLTGYQPKQPQFTALREALRKLRAPQTQAEPAAAPSAPVVKIPNGPLLKVGSKHEQVALLRQRLSIAADKPDEERLFDQRLADAVKAFQRGAELKATGMLNNATRQALNGDVAEAKDKTPDRAKQIQRVVLNMERWRWEPADLGTMYVWDNIPEFMTRVIKDGSVIHQEKIIVGKTDTQTPIFSARMQYVVFHPEWGVPDSIKVKEILPYLRRPAYDGFLGFGGSVSDTRILQRHNLRVTMNGRPVDASQVDWNAVDIRHYTFVQPAGGQNVLGVVKFRFPNKHDVYMHDTPQRELFSAKSRTFSHGCMRVHNPQRLAEVILGEDQGMSSAQVESLIKRGGGPTEITLKKQFPVHVTYMTAVVDGTGKLDTFSDIYGHDARLQLALSGKQTEFFDAPDVAARPDALAREARMKRRAPPKEQAGPANFLSALFGN